jgi:membrane-bound lytic murein transglycosylase B
LIIRRKGAKDAKINYYSSLFLRVLCVFAAKINLMPLKRLWNFVTVLIALLGVLAGPVHAISVEEYPELASIIDTLATQHGFERTTLKHWFADAKLRPEIIVAMERPREGLPWHQYRPTFLNDERIRLGRRYWDEHAAVLARAQQQYGVPAEIIVAIIGVETYYGKNKGDYPVLDALLTLTLRYPRRATFFRRELEEFLLLARELKRDPRKIQGSYAGAMGIPQFIPSSYRLYAVDHDGNHRRDLLESHADAIGSVGSFLSQHGWISGEPVVDPAQLDGPLTAWMAQLGMQPLLPLHEWVGRGVFPRRDPGVSAIVANDDMRHAALITLEGTTGPMYYLGYNNFYVITRYNRSKNYAMAVHELGRMIRLQRQGKQ